MYRGPPPLNIQISVPYVQEYVVFNSTNNTLFTTVRLHGSAITGSIGFTRNNVPNPFYFDIAACNQGWCSEYSLPVH